VTDGGGNGGSVNSGSLNGGSVNGGGLRVVGAGLGRTGTHSLKLALEQLLGGRCYHMLEVFGRPEDVADWQRAFDGRPPEWTEFFGEFTASVDWPSAAFWREQADAFPDALVLLSVRRDPDAWWNSADRTIFEPFRGASFDAPDEWTAMVTTMLRGFTPDLDDADAVKAAYERHNDAVRAGVPADRLLEWQPGDGWEPLCTALGVPVPDEDFPHTNTTAEFRERAGWD